MIINERGQASLRRANCLESVLAVGNLRKKSYIFNGQTGEKKSIPKKIPGIGCTRPIIAECLAEIAAEKSEITIRKGKGVSKVSKDNDSGLLKVHMEDGLVLDATHVIGADGKWSKVRQSFPSLASQGKIVTCPSFAVHMMSPQAPDGWDTNGTYLIKPSEECMFYIITSPVPTGELSISIICYDETVEKYPWLEPPNDIMESDADGFGDWSNEYSPLSRTESRNTELSNKIATLLETELPEFYSAIGRETIDTVRIKRRVSWLQMSPSGGSNVAYSTPDGQVALVGDSAHSMTPSMGEGCNTAMESAVKLVDGIVAAMRERELERCDVSTLNAAFIEYGLSRPQDTQSIQERSAVTSSSLRNV